ncbi:MAG: sigma-70 family RNA polymerase sigma factor [Deferrisomatales bacterium]|nr:sigma-70 family RNA polymerase sigma factor [Deferrisomatales bacterium]
MPARGDAAGRTPFRAAPARPPQKPGSRGAAWVADHADALFRYASSRVGDRETALDLVQQSLAAALASATAYRGAAAPRTWLIGILRHKIADHFRDRSRMAGSLDASDEGAWFDGSGRWRASAGEPGPGPAAQLDRSAFRQALSECLRNLPPRQASAFVLREMEGIPTPELSALLGTTPDNLWVLLHRARLALRSQLARRGFGAGDLSGQ